MTGTDSRATARIAYLEWTEHRFFAYRGCAPDADNPRRAAGNPELPLDAWCGGEDRDGAASQKERRAQDAAALEVCLGCPVMVACDRYANSVTPEGKLAEPDGIRGGRTARERCDAFKARRHEVTVAVPDARFRTPQRQAVLLALAMCVVAEEVAAAAGMDLRTANWQRSRMTTDLKLCKATATRGELLAEAVRRGLLDAELVVADDGSVPAVPPPPTGPLHASAPAGVEAGAEGAESAVAEDANGTGPDDVAVTPVPCPEVVPYEPVHVPTPARRRFAGVTGQLALWEAELADVHPLFPARPLEAAA